MAQSDSVDRTFPSSSISRPRRAFRLFRTWPVFPILIIGLMAFAAIFAPFVSPHDPTRGDLLHQSTPPFWYPEGSTQYLLGTDALGRDIFSRIIHGARVSLLIVGVVLTAGAIGGTMLGIAAGYFGAQVDEILMRLVDFTFAVPFILVALVVVIVLGQSLLVIIALLVIFSWGGFARQVRAEVLSIKTREYVEFAKLSGAPPGRIMYRHILPGVTNTIVVIATLRVGALIITESVLSYLGVGIPPPTPAWGLMVSQGRDHLLGAWWIAFFPGMAILLVVMAMNFLGDWMRDRFDPRLKQL